jgi:hypothetical protein
MKTFAAPLVAATAALCAAAASGWQFTYVDPRGRSYIVNDPTNQDRGCTPINHGRGKTFAWDRPNRFNSCCINLYANNACSGSAQGLSCPDWSKPASTSLYGFTVTNC